MSSQQDVYNEIGKNAGLEGYETKVILGKHPPLLVFFPKGSYRSGSNYTINLFTLNPTESSPNKTPLTKELKFKLLELRAARSGQTTLNKFIAR